MDPPAERASRRERTWGAPRGVLAAVAALVSHLTAPRPGGSSAFWSGKRSGRRRARSAVRRPRWPLEAAKPRARRVFGSARSGDRTRALT